MCDKPVYDDDNIRLKLSQTISSVNEMYARTAVDAGKSDHKVLFLTGSIDPTILLKQVSSLWSFPESSAIVTFASKNKYRRLGNNNTKLYLLDSLDKFDLVLFDEFVMYKDMALDAVTTAAINSHIILVTIK